MDKEASWVKGKDMTGAREAATAARIKCWMVDEGFGTAFSLLGEMQCAHCYLGDYRGYYKRT